MGSKNKIAIDLLQAMLKEKPKAKYFFDLCGGGGAFQIVNNRIKRWNFSKIILE